MAFENHGEAGMVGALAFLKSVPSWAWGLGAALVLALGVYLYGASQYNAGKQEILDRLEQAETDAKLAAEKAMREADSEAEKRALAHAATQSTLNKVISDAESSGGNSLDALFDSLRPEGD